MNGGDITSLLVYLDDMFVTYSNNNNEIEQLRSNLTTEFEMLLTY